MTTHPEPRDPLSPEAILATARRTYQTDPEFHAEVYLAAATAAGTAVAENGITDQWLRDLVRHVALDAAATTLSLYGRTGRTI